MRNDWLLSRHCGNQSAKIRFSRLFLNQVNIVYAKLAALPHLSESGSGTSAGKKYFINIVLFYIVKVLLSK